MKIFQTQFNKGSLIEKQTGSTIALTNIEFKRKEKGQSLSSTTATPLGAISSTIILGTTFSFGGYINSKNLSSINVLAGAGANHYPLGMTATAISTSDGVDTATTNYTFKINTWYFILVTRNGTICNFYVNGTLVGTDTLTSNNSVSISRLFQRWSDFYLLGYCAEQFAYDHILTSKERADAYNDFLHAHAPSKEIYPRLDTNDFKPTDLSRLANTGLKAAYNYKESGNNTDISGSGFNDVTTGNVSTTIHGRKYAVNGKSVIGNLGNIKTMTFRIKPVSTTEKLMEGAANDKLIHIAAATLTYPEFDNAFIDGIDTNAMVAGQWQSIVITSSTDVGFSACTLALNNATYGNFEIANLQFWSNEFTGQQARDYHNSFIAPVLVADFKNDAVGQTKPFGFTPGTGSFVVKEMTTQNAVLKHLDKGTKYLQNSVAGTIAIPSKFAYGAVEFDLYKGADSNAVEIGITQPKIINRASSSGGYWITLGSDERIYLLKDTGTSPLNYSAVSYITINTWYRIRITRSKAGVFTIFIKGGAFTPTAGYDGWTLVSVVGGSGTNPVTDNTYTTSEYIVADLDAGDRIANIKWLSEVYIPIYNPLSDPIINTSVIIGDQEWTLKNVNINIEGSRVYNDNEANRAIYGGLYTWNMIAQIEAAYPGWHVPSTAEFNNLEVFLTSNAGGKCKEVGLEHWNTPNYGATNASGWTGLGAGYYTGVVYRDLKDYGFFWTTSDDGSPTEAYYWWLTYNDAVFHSINHGTKTDFLSVRLIKD